MINNPFIEEIEEDYHQALLETGNLQNLKRKSHQWTGKDCWLAEGFLAKVVAQECTRCQAINFNLLGVFRLESNAARRASHLVAIKPGEPLPSPENTPSPDQAHLIEIHVAQIPVCVSCLPSFGFPDVKSAFSAL